jgi:uncharacterized membrane protein
MKFMGIFSGLLVNDIIVLSIIYLYLTASFVDNPHALIAKGNIYSVYSKLLNVSFPGSRIF